MTPLEWLGGSANRVALDFDGSHVTYRELQNRVAARAARLSRANSHTAPHPVDPTQHPVDVIESMLAAMQIQVPVIIGTLPAAGPSRAASSVPPPTDIPAGCDLVVFTSGSSATAKPVYRTSESWSASAPPLAELAELTPEDRVMLTGSLAASLHLYAALHTLWLGATLTDDRRTATAAHLTPTRLQRMTIPPAMRRIVVAGAALPDRLRATIDCRDVHLFEYYGAAELSFVGYRDGDAYRAFPGVEVDVRGRVLWARSRYLAHSVARDAAGFATVEDHAEALPDERFRLLGRGDAAITTAGTTLHAETIEEILAEVPGIHEVAVVGEPDELLGERVVAVFVGDPQIAVAALARAARARLSAPELPRRWYRTAQLPRTASGKLARGRIREAVAAGAFTPLPLGTD